MKIVVLAGGLSAERAVSLVTGCGVCRALRGPGMWMQNFTTFEPDDSMIEVGIEALKRVLPEEKGADRW